MFEAAANIVRALAWPTVAVVLLLLYRDSIRTLVNRLSRRLVGISVFQVSVQFVPPPPPQLSQPIEEIRTRELVGESLTDILSSLSTETPLTYIEVNLEERWLSSRLFLLTYLLYRVRDLRCVVFVAKVDGIRNRYLGLASAPELCRALSEHQPWLEAAYSDAIFELADEIMENTYPYQRNRGAKPRPEAIVTLGTDDTGSAVDVVSFLLQRRQHLKEALDSQWVKELYDMRRLYLQQELGSLHASEIAEHFREILQREPPSKPEGNWVPAGNATEHATVVTAEELPELLKNALYPTAYFFDRPELDDHQRQQQVILRGWSRNGIGLPYIAAVDENRVFEQLVDRARLIEAVARRAVQDDS